MYTAIPLVAVALITMGRVARRQNWPWRDWLRGGAAFIGALAVSVGWWAGWVWRHFNQVNMLGPVLGLVKPLLPGATVDDNPTTSRLTALLSGQFALKRLRLYDVFKELPLCSQSKKFLG